jgi:O-antigen/teichoic acid export membrane protein
VGTSVLSVIFALSGHYWPGSPLGGAMALILPRPLVSATVMLVSFRLSGFRPRLRPCFRRWGYVLRDSRYFFFTSLFGTFLNQGDYLLTGLFFTTDQLGVYYFAFNLSTQTAQLVSTNLTMVLLPSFAKLDREPKRQRAAYLRICSMIALVGVVLCIIQALMAGPLLHLVFHEKWDDAIPLVQILTVGMVFLLPSSPGMPLLQSQGRYRKVMLWTAIVASAFLTSVGLGTLFGSTETIAIAVAAFYGVFGPLGVWIPLPFNRQTFMEIIRRIYAFPVIAGLAACGGGLWISILLVKFPEFARGCLVSLAALLVYGAAALIWRRGDLGELVARVRSLMTRVAGNGNDGAVES